MSAAAFTVSASQFTGAKQRRALNARAVTASSSRRAVVAVAAGPKKIVIAGAPASGKGTQCELIVDKYGLEHISAGDLLRAAVAAGTDLGVRAKEFMDRGDLVPDEVVVGMVVEALDTDKAKSAGWLLDGYPRSASQADAITKEGIIPDAVILLDVPDDILVERVVGRRMDPETGKIYHLKFNPPPADVAARVHAEKRRHRGEGDEQAQGAPLQRGGRGGQVRGEDQRDRRQQVQGGRLRRHLRRPSTRCDSTLRRTVLG